MTELGPRAAAAEGRRHAKQESAGLASAALQAERVAGLRLCGLGEQRLRDQLKYGGVYRLCKKQPTM